ncbi:MAG: 2-dehydro-3-deoxyglucarate aldolase [Gammaproteobacteria bacterium]|nr:2-dehydro-3-deoxyglucarate aldolase [Gammaproteobacteria bacterium]HBW85042.1 2-dehydro-3-deoxyglucarate aldolase [Gammaproteobacteria bacterium]|tara:strand:- start:5707 stop:6480 length:774 start_codon:yes stop_codon:yes gene_type:complete
MADPLLNKAIVIPAANQPSLIGAWLNLASPLVTEALAATGYDWLMIDAEHGPNDVTSVLGQLQAVSAYPAIPVVRLPNHDASLIKRYLDIGVANLLIPMVENAAEAEAIIRSTRYPVSGIRGVGAGLARASRWSLNSEYLNSANAEVKAIVQIETVAGLSNLSEILSVKGIDAVFFGPADIAASLDSLGNSTDVAVQDLVLRGIEEAASADMSSGVFSGDQAFLRRCERAGARLLGVTSDVSLLISGGKRVLADFKI